MSSDLHLNLLHVHCNWTQCKWTLLQRAYSFFQHCPRVRYHRHPLADTPPRQTPPLGRHPLSRHPLLVQTTLRADTLGRHPLPNQTVTAVDGTHPTEMHS